MATTITKSAAETTVNLLNTVGTLATSASKAVTTVASSLDMLDLFVQSNFTKQQLRTKVDLHYFTETLIEDSSIDNAERQLEIISKLNENENLKKLYAENESKIRTLLIPA